MNTKFDVSLKKNKIILIIIIIIVVSSPLHVKVVESSPKIDTNGFVIIQYQDGLLRISDDSDVGTVFTDIEELNKWEICTTKNIDPKIKRVFLGLFIKFADMDGQKIRQYRSNLWKVILECPFDKIRFLNKFL